jgi:hypothetical protein
MHKSVTLLAAVALAGAAFAGVSAFTASNSIAPVGVSGYGEDTATGATITNVATTPLASDNSKVDHVTFTSSTDVTGKTASMTLRMNASRAVVGTPYTCTLGTYALGTMTITCATPDNPDLRSFDTTGLTVV